MLYTPVVLIHICGAVVGILSGVLSMILRKGSGLHRMAGTFFVAGMTVMAASGILLAAFIHPNRGNVMGGTLTLYVVATGWIAGRRRQRTVGAFDWIALATILGLIAMCATWGIQAKASPKGSLDGYPAFLFFVFGSIAAIFATSDIRMIARGGIEGARRISRHLVRMSLALLFAMFSFYPARAHLFSKAINDSHLMYVPHILIAGAMFFWLARVRLKRSRSNPQIDAAALAGASHA